MHGPINVKSPNNTSKWQMGFNSAFKGLIRIELWETSDILCDNIILLKVYRTVPELITVICFGTCVDSGTV
jgi:hypothetical protein